MRHRDLANRLSQPPSTSLFPFLQELCVLSQADMLSVHFLLPKLQWYLGFLNQPQFPPSRCTDQVLHSSFSTSFRHQDFLQIHHLLLHKFVLLLEVTSSWYGNHIGTLASYPPMFHLCPHFSLLRQVQSQQKSDFLDEYLAESIVHDAYAGVGENSILSWSRALLDSDRTSQSLHHLPTETTHSVPSPPIQHDVHLPFPFDYPPH